VSIIAWPSLGVLAGFVASKPCCGTGRGVLLDVAFGIVPAAVGGSFLCNVLGNAPVLSIGAYRLIAAATGASTVLCMDHALARRRRRSASAAFVPPALHCRASARPCQRRPLPYQTLWRPR